MNFNFKNSLKLAHESQPVNRLPTIFLAVALFFGSLVVFITPPFQSPDEFNHFFRAWQVSEGHVFPEKTADHRLGGQLPVSLDSLRRRFDLLRNHYDATTSFSTIYGCHRLPLEPEKRTFLDFPNTAIYSPTAYLPQASAIRLLRFFDAPPIFMLWLGRFFNLLVWAWLVQNALKIMPFQRMTMAFLALLPSSLAIAGSLNADVLTNGLACWLVAFFVKNSHSTTHETASSKMKIGLATAVISLNKLVFAPLVLLHFLAFQKRKNWLVGAFGLLAVAGSCTFFWAKTAADLFIPFDSYHPQHRDFQTLNEEVQPTAQVRFILENPFRFAKIASKSFADSLPSTAAHLLGKFGWEKNYLPGWLLGLLGLALAALVFSEENPLSKRQRSLLFLTGLGCVVLFSITMYALWNPVGSPVLSNLQGRYFVPVLPVFALAIGKNWFKKWPFGWLQIAQNAAWLVLFSAEIGLLICLWQRYF